VFQCFLWFPDYEHFGFQGLRRRGRPLIPFQGRLGTNPDIGPSPLIPPPRGGAASIRTRCGETNGRRPRAAWVDCFSNHTHLEWSCAPTLVNQFPGKAHRPRNGMKNPPHYGIVSSVRIWRGRQGEALPLTQPDRPGSDRSTVYPDSSN